MKQILCCIFLFSMTVHADPSYDLTDGWKFNPDSNNVGTEQKWFAPEHDDSDWTDIEAGKRWEDQGFPDLDGHGWYRISVDIPPDWQGRRAWIAFGGVNDSYVLYCNGKQVAAYGDKGGFSTARFPTMTELTDYLNPGTTNLIALDVYDWTKSGGLWRSPCLLTTDPSELPVVTVTTCWPEYADNELTVQTVVTGLGDNRPLGRMQFDLYKMGESELLGSRTESIPLTENLLWSTFRIPRTEEDVLYEIRSKGIDPNGEIIAGTVDSATALAFGKPDYPPEYNALNVLNNFVTELLSVEYGGDGENEFEFRNPKEGWVYFGIHGSGISDEDKVFLDGEESPLKWRLNPDTGDLESMRRLSAGSHTLQITSQPGLSHLVVRSIPLLAYCRFPGDSAVEENGPYDWEFLERFVLPHVNTITTQNKNLEEAPFEEWIDEGRMWIDQLHLAGLNPKEKVTGGDVYEKWKDEPGVTDPNYGGIIIDEFINRGNVEQYRAWTRGLELLSADSHFHGKQLYAWCGLMARYPATHPFRRAIVKHDHRFVWEQYMPEEANDEEARSTLIRRFVDDLLRWKADEPEISGHLIQCLGYFSEPPGTLDHDPGVNFKVYLDKQFRILATEPALWGQCGVLPWLSSLADEEVIRWTHQLIRHYCIEGNTDLLSTDPYVLPHVQNPDFEEGLSHWTIEPAEEDSISAGHLNGFGYLQRGYPQSPNGDTFVRMVGSPLKPNRIRQTVRDLKPGRLYSFEMISADLAHVDQSELLPVVVELEGVELLDNLSFRRVFRCGGTCRDDETGKTYSNPNMNYHRWVFRAKDRTAELIISDRGILQASQDFMPRELACNYIQVQPYMARPEK